MEEYVKTLVETVTKQQEQITSLCQALNDKAPVQVQVAHAPRNAVFPHVGTYQNGFLLWSFA